MCNRCTVSDVLDYDCIFAVKLAVVFRAFQCIKQFFYKIVYIEQLKFCVSVVYRDRKIVRHIIAEYSNCAIVVRSAPLAEQIRKTVDESLSTGFLCVVKKQFFSRFFAFAVIAVVSSNKRCLNRV